MTAFPWITGLVACTVAAVAAYGITRLVTWAGHALPDLYDTDLPERTWSPGDSPILPPIPDSAYPPGAMPLLPLEPNDTSETGGPQ